MKGRRAVVIGGAGFLGSHLTDALLGDGWEILVVDNLLTGDLGNLAPALRDPRCSFMHLDVSMYLAVSGPVDAIFHFASAASPVDYLAFPIQTLKVGSRGTHNALGLARATGARFLLASTSEVYGDPQVHPQPEDYWGHVNPIGPRGVYDEAKRFAEALTMAYARAHGLQTRIVRIFNCFGPRMRPGDGRAVPEFVAAALHERPLVVHGDGSQTRSLCYVSDLVDGIIRLFHSDVGTPVNIGNPHEMTVLEIAKRIVALTGSRSPIEFGPRPVDDPSVRSPDITKARTLLGWEPRVDVDTGLKLTIADLRERLGIERDEPATR